ncbi:MAG: flagellar hook capping FlgD N-terminal domain-containing protein [Micavibrio sp.]
MATAPVTTAGVVNNAQKTATAGVKLAEDFQQFLTLLTTQLQNQDPLSPMDSTEFTNQLVQFSQVEQQINMNQKMDNLVSLQLASISTVALGYVGMDISYLSAEMNYDGTTPVDVNYALASEAVTSRINIYNEEGTLVYSHDAPKNVGTNKFTWNGTSTGGAPLEPGTYSVKIDALDKDGKVIENSTVVSGNVRGIETQNGVVYVLVGERAIMMSNIVNATVPQPAQEANNTAPPPGDSGSDDEGDDGEIPEDNV